MSLARVRDETVSRTSVWTCTLRGGSALLSFNAALRERELPLSKPFMMEQSDVKLCCSVRDVMMTVQDAGAVDCQGVLDVTGASVTWCCQR